MGRGCLWSLALLGSAAMGDLGAHVGDALAARARETLDAGEVAAWERLATQTIDMGIDYASLGLSWDHPQSRAASCGRDDVREILTAKTTHNRHRRVS